MSRDEMMNKTIRDISELTCKGIPPTKTEGLLCVIAQTLVTISVTLADIRDSLQAGDA